METIATILFVLAVTAVFIFISAKKKKSAWEGVLVKKKTHEDYESGNTTYRLIFKTTEGKKVKMWVNSIVYNQYEEGQKVVKKSGEYMPEKVM